LNWHIVYSDPGQEKTAAYWLRYNGFEAYWPTHKLIVPKMRRELSHSQRNEQGLHTKEIIRPLFPRYLFVRGEGGESLYAMCEYTGVAGIIAFGERLATLSEEQMVELQTRVALGEFTLDKVPKPKEFKAGDEVFVVRDWGKVGGRVERVDSSSRIVEVLASIFGRATRVITSAEELVAA